MKQIIYTPDAPQPIGPYSQAVIVNNILYTSGQIAIDPKSNALILATIEDETHQVMQNIQAILTSQKLDFNAVFKCTIFIKDMNHFAQINAVYGSYFDEANAPVRETVEVSRLPKDVNIEISVMAQIK